MISAFYIEFAFYLFTVVVSMVLVGLMMRAMLKNQTIKKRYIFLLIGYIVMTQLGIGLPIFLNYQRGDFDLNNELVGKEFVATDEDEQISMLQFLDDKTVTITLNDGSVIEDEYRLTGNDRFYISQSLDGQNNNGKIENGWKHLKITITRPSGILNFEETK